MPVYRFIRIVVTASAARGHRTRHAPAMVKLVVGLGFCLGLSALVFAGAARAADMPAPPPPVLPLWTWTGGYVGTHVGAAWGDAKFSDPAGTSLFGDNVSTPGFIGGFQAGYNWQVPQTRFVLGIEGDLSGLASKGSNTCLASSRLVVSADCRVEPNASATVTPRIGYAIDPLGRTLAYIKGGFAAIHNGTEISTNGTTPKTETTDRLWATGWTAGAGVERALTPAWSLRLEYDYLGLGRVNIATPPGQVQTVPGDFTSYQATPAGTASLSQNVQEVKFALNYRFGVDPFAHWSDLPQPVAARAAWMPPAKSGHLVPRVAIPGRHALLAEFRQIPERPWRQRVERRRQCAGVAALISFAGKFGRVLHPRRQPGQAVCQRSGRHRRSFFRLYER